MPIVKSILLINSGLLIVDFYEFIGNLKVQRCTRNTKMCKTSQA